jgi:hypothetical protein
LTVPITSFTSLFLFNWLLVSNFKEIIEETIL